MTPEPYTLKELKLTATVYATCRGVVEHVRATGHLPDEFPSGGLSIASRLIIQQRGVDNVLTPNEELVLRAILVDKKLPAGGVRLLENYDPQGNRIDAEDQDKPKP